MSRYRYADAKIGDIVQWENKLLKVKPNFGHCPDCFFYNKNCSGVACVSAEREEDGNVWYKDAVLWVFRLSITNTTFVALGYCSSRSHLICLAQSSRVLCSCASAKRQPLSGSVNIKMQAVPFRMYSLSSYSIRPSLDRRLFLAFAKS